MHKIGRKLAGEAKLDSDLSGNRCDVLPLLGIIRLARIPRS
jgi:hypothetical protein